MIYGRAALAVAVVLSGIRTVPAAPCVPRAQVEGDAAAVALVARELRKLGVQVGDAAPAAEAASACRTVRAQVVLEHEGGIAVAIVDGSRRREGRVVSDAAVAAAWIDSWLRDELDGVAVGDGGRAGRVVDGKTAGTGGGVDGRVVDGATASDGGRSGRVVDGKAAGDRPRLAAVELPDGRLGGGAPSPLRGVDRGSRPAARDGSASRPSRPALARFAVAAGYEHTWSDDDATASGFSAGGCVRVGPACFGARAQYAPEHDRTLPLTAMRRADLSVLATASLSVAVGRMAVSPELGFGVGRRRTQRDDCTPAAMQPNSDPGCDPMDPSCMMTRTTPLSCADASGANGAIYVGDELDAITYTPRASASLRLAVPLFDHVWLEGLATLALAPFGHSERFSATVPPTTMPGSLDLSLPGEPARAFQLGIGLRLGAR